MSALGDPVPAAEGSSIISVEAKALYLHILQQGGSLEADGAPLSGAQRELLELGLLIPDSPDARVLTAADPDRLAGKLSSLWQTEALALLSRAVAVPTALQDLTRAYGALDRQIEAGGPVEYVRGLAAINQQLDSLVEGADKEVLTAQPGGRRRKISMQGIGQKDLKAVRRGISRRTIYHPSARYSTSTRQYVAEVTAQGAEVRTLAEPFTRLIIIDRSVAVIPTQGNTEKAAFVRDEAVVGYLTDVFDGLWDRSIPFPGSAEVPQEVISRLRGRIIQMLIQGVGHRVIARSLGLSERTLARHIAELREEYDSETLFQLGWRMAQNPPHSVDEPEPES
ncbi:hypothetical protein GCM10009665_15380 [Kitasatospora nipponensis]|uniref:HTH luxR-type domain-containing protein n=1 Tax=Kitasatospora nipponensis TaxID=258049 RepID=A0ABP4GN35_9ACTN